MSLSSLDLSHNNLAQMAGVHLAAALVRITILITTVRRRKKRIVMMMMMTMMINNMYLSSLDLSHNNLVQMVGIHLAAALVRMILLVTTVIRRIVKRRKRSRITDNMSLPSLDLNRNNLAQMAGGRY